MSSGPWARHLAAIAGYLGIALAFSWPLPLKLTSALTGAPSGDTGVYVWNLWIFRHELEHGLSPFFAREILSLRPALPLTLHNYTPLTNLLAYPFMSMIGVTATFNLVYLASSIITAYAMFLLARDVTRSTGESWLAGLLFSFSPALLARGTGHFSLVQAAPLPVFVLLLRRLERRVSLRDAVLAGGALAWAYLSDPYYAVYAVLLGISYAALSRLKIEWPKISRRALGFRRVLDSTAALSLAIAVVTVVSGGGTFEVAGRRISATTAYTPMLVTTILVAAHFALTARLRWTGPQIPHGLFSPEVVGTTLVASVVPLLPLLQAARAEADASWLWPRVFWRSSAAGVDALAFLLPNPHHALLGAWSTRWLTSRPNGLAENVGSLTFVALLTIAVAYGCYHFRRGRGWFAITALFAWLAMGPFIVVAGFNTQIPTPWALLRYLPIVGGARMPARFAILVMLAVAVLFALALKRITATHRQRRGWILAAVGGVLVFELSPFPRPLYDATIPTIYRTIAEDPRQVRVLEIPTGIRDGLSSHGDFSALSQYNQTLHEKRLIGGYLSRMPQSEIRAYRRRTVFGAILRLSEGETLTPEQLERARRHAPEFLERARVGWIVIDLNRASPALMAFVEDAFPAQPVGEAAGRRLYRTACCRRGGITR